MYIRGLMKYKPWLQQKLAVSITKRRRRKLGFVFVVSIGDEILQGYKLWKALYQSFVRYIVSLNWWSIFEASIERKNHVLLVDTSSTLIVGLLLSSSSSISPIGCVLVFSVIHGIYLFS